MHSRSKVTSKGNRRGLPFPDATGRPPPLFESLRVIYLLLADCSIRWRRRSNSLDFARIQFASGASWRGRHTLSWAGASPCCETSCSASSMAAIFSSMRAQFFGKRHYINRVARTLIGHQFGLHQSGPNHVECQGRQVISFCDCHVALPNARPEILLVDQFETRRALIPVIIDNSLSAGLKLAANAAHGSCCAHSRAVITNWFSIPTLLLPVWQNSGASHLPCEHWFPVRGSLNVQPPSDDGVRRREPSSTLHFPVLLPATRPRDNDGTIWQTAERKLPGLTYFFGAFLRSVDWTSRPVKIE